MKLDEFAEWNARELARRPVSRRSVLQAAGGLAAASLALAACDSSTGPRGLTLSGRHLAFSPDAAGHPAGAMAVTAQLTVPDGRLPSGLRAFIDVGDAPGSYGTKVEARIVHLTGQYAIPNGPATSQYYVKARLDGLRPLTVHHYRIRLSDGTTTPDAHFTTAPTHGDVPAPFTFTAFADVGTDRMPPGGSWKAKHFVNDYDHDDPVAGHAGTDPHPATTQTRLMGTQRPAFTLLAGDICYAETGGSGLPADDRRPTPHGRNPYDPYVWDEFLGQIDTQASSVPWMFATGNHDMEPIYGSHGYGGHAQRLDLPGNGPAECPSVYRFTYANVGVVSIDANDLSAEIQTNTGYSGGMQVAWLEQTLQAFRSDPAIDFVVTFFHHCAFGTTNAHGSDGGVRSALDPLFSRYEVDLAVQGHNHVLERTDPIRNGRRTRSAPDGATIHPAQDGTTYLCAGSGGRSRSALRSAPTGDAVPSGPTSLPEGPRYRGYRPDGRSNTGEQVVNAFRWSKRGTTTRNGVLTGTTVPESIDWSQVRYDGYAFLAVDVRPAARGARTTMTIRTLADALPGTKAPYTEIDRITLERTAGAAGLRAGFAR